jgi:acyl carrier protein
VNREQIQASLVKIVSAQLGIEKTAVAIDKTWDELGADSLDALEICIDVEDEFGVDIGDTVADTLTTPAKALDHLCTLLGVTAP